MGARDLSRVCLATPCARPPAQQERWRASRQPAEAAGRGATPPQTRRARKRAA